MHLGGELSQIISQIRRLRPSRSPIPIGKRVTRPGRYQVELPRLSFALIRVRRVIYISKSKVGSDPTELDAIVARSSALNEVAGITGMLWSNDACFAQVLEGEHDAVGETMDRIRADPRHFDVDVVSDRTITRRLFGEWAMIRSVGRSETMAGTAFLVGFAMGERTASAHQLYQILVASEG